MVVGRCLVVEVERSGIDAPDHEDPDRQQHQELQQALERDREHQALVPFGRVHLSGAEQDAEGCEGDGDVE